MRRVHLLLPSLLTTALLLAGCGGGPSGDEEKDGPGGQEVAKGSTLNSTWPLTGLHVKGNGSAAQKHPVMVLKMDNTASSAPQVGLGKADLVVEELVEGGMTRLAAFFYSDIPANAGPVRSMRASDIGIVKPADASMVTSGAAPITIRRIKGAGIEFFAEGGPGIYRESSRSAPYNLFADMRKTAAAAAGDRAVRPDDYLPWGSAKDLPKGKAAKSLTASFGAHETTWVFRDGAYANVNTYAAEGDEFRADNVLVLRVQVGDAGYRDPAGYPVPETKFTGKGEALLFHDGRVVRGTWSKTGLESALSLSTKAGELTVPAGHTWIELVPAKTGGLTFSK